MHNLENHALIPHRARRARKQFGDIINYQKSLLDTLPAAFLSWPVVAVKQCAVCLPSSLCQMAPPWVLWSMSSSNDTDHEQLLTDGMLRGGGGGPYSLCKVKGTPLHYFFFYLHDQTAAGNITSCWFVENIVCASMIDLYEAELCYIVILSILFKRMPIKWSMRL